MALAGGSFLDSRNWRLEPILVGIRASSFLLPCLLVGGDTSGVIVRRYSAHAKRAS
ncbi:MAG: hypothetical protein ACXU9M_14540 [Thermodesulfobacteriota bacterium]